MIACVLHEVGPVTSRPLRVEEVPTPSARPGEVVIRVRACGVCRTDLHVVEGELDQSRQKRPVIPGHQVVGEIVGEPNAPRVGVAWLHSTCGDCRFCSRQRENLCERAEFTGYTRDGGFAEYIVAPREFIYPLPPGLDDLHVAPLLCAGIIGYRCLRMCAGGDWRSAMPGFRLGIYGFGAAGHIAIQIARARGAEVYVFTRDRNRHQRLAEELGAKWVGDTFDGPPDGVRLDASIIFAPAGGIVPAALDALDRGARLVLGGIHMSDIPALEYRRLYHERGIVSVANNTRVDGREFLDEAVRAQVRTSATAFPLDQANEALIALKNDAIRGAAVLTM